MREIRYPGVYAEERPFGAAPIAGVEASSTGFVGEAPDGPQLAATKIRSFAEFERAFGGLRSGSELGYGVLQFFANGGGEAWVVGVPVGTPLAEGLSCLEAADLDGLGPRAKVFVVHRDERALVFGDGMNGEVPPAGAGNVQATYRYDAG